MAKSLEESESNLALILQLKEENATLKEVLRQSEVAAEAHAQEAHSLRSQVQLLTVMQSDYQAEIDNLQQSQSQHEQSLEAALLKLKDKYAAELHDLQEKIEYLEAELCEEQAQHALQLKELKQVTSSNDVGESTLVLSLKAELQEALNMQVVNHQACQQHQELNLFLSKQLSDLQNELQNKTELLEVSQVKLNISKTDCKEKTDALEDLRESFVQVQNELASLKSQPCNSQARGNSLFAEVEDHRQTAVKRLVSLHQELKAVKRDYAVKCDEIAKLKLEKLKICQTWKEEIEERDKAEFWLTDNFQIRIKELQEMVTYLKGKENPVFIEGDSKILKYADHLVQQTRKEFQELRDEMEYRSVQRLQEAEALYEVRSELRSLKAQVISLETENQYYKEKLKEAGASGLTLPCKSTGKLDNFSNPSSCPAIASSSSINCEKQFGLPPDKYATSKKCAAQVFTNSADHTESASRNGEPDSGTRIAISPRSPPIKKEQCQNNSTEKGISEELTSFQSPSASQPDIVGDSKEPPHSPAEVSTQIAHHDKLNLQTVEELSDCVDLRARVEEVHDLDLKGAVSEDSVTNTSNSENESPVLVDSMIGCQKSILTKSSVRSYLEDLSNFKPEKKVSFIVNEFDKSDTQSAKSSDSSSSDDTKKRFSRIPPRVSYKTNFIVSKETD